MFNWLRTGLFKKRQAPSKVADMKKFLIVGLGNMGSDLSLIHI